MGFVGPSLEWEQGAPAGAPDWDRGYWTPDSPEPCPDDSPTGVGVEACDRVEREERKDSTRLPESRPQESPVAPAMTPNRPQRRLQNQGPGSTL